MKKLFAVLVIVLMSLSFSSTLDIKTDITYVEIDGVDRLCEVAYYDYNENNQADTDTEDGECEVIDVIYILD